MVQKIPKTSPRAAIARDILNSPEVVDSLKSRGRPQLVEGQQQSSASSELPGPACLRTVFVRVSAVLSGVCDTESCVSAEGVVDAQFRHERIDRDWGSGQAEGRAARIEGQRYLRRYIAEAAGDTETPCLGDTSTPVTRPPIESVTRAASLLPSNAPQLPRTCPHIA